MTDNVVVDFVKQQDWLKPIGQKSDELVKIAIDKVGSAGTSTKDLLINSRLLGHKRHPAITDVPLGSWTVTLISDALDLAGQPNFATAADTSLAVGLVASILASASGLADLSETHGRTDRRLGMMHGILQGVTTLLFSSSFLARRLENRAVGRSLSLAGYATFIASAYLANQLAERREA